MIIWGTTSTIIILLLTTSTIVVKSFAKITDCGTSSALCIAEKPKDFPFRRGCGGGRNRPRDFSFHFLCNSFIHLFAIFDFCYSSGCRAVSSFCTRTATPVAKTRPSGWFDWLVWLAGGLVGWSSGSWIVRWCTNLSGRSIETWESEETADW